MRSRWTIWGAVAVVILVQMHEPLRGNETFAHRRQQALQTEFQKVSQWFLNQSAPYHPDALDALEWLLETAFQQGWYTELSPLVEKKGLFDTLHPTLQKKRQQIHLLATAARGKSEEALQLFGNHLKGVRIRQPNDTLVLAYALSAQLQINGDYSAAQEVYRQMIDAFFLNAQVRLICERRNAKLLLADHQAPDFDAGGFHLKDFAGKHVLIDFWATNCAPCLIDLPFLKSVARRDEEENIRILGISFDTNQEVIDEFRHRHRIDWPTPLLENCNSALREDFRVVTIPSTFVIDPAGKIVLVDGNARDVALLLEKSRIEKSRSAND